MQDHENTAADQGSVATPVLGADPPSAPGAVEQASERRSRLRRPSSQALLLAVCCVAQFMVILDLSIVNVALPHIQSALGFSSPELQWIVDAYSISFAGFLMLGGRVADQFGHRRIFVVSLAMFALASAIGGAAQGREMLIAARALQGCAGAFMAATSLAIITASFKPGPQLHRAIGAWAAMNGLGGAAGMLLGGVITEFLSWRWILLINPPIGLAAAAVAYYVVAERRRAKKDASFDLLGAVLLTVGQIVLVYGVVEGGLAGWGSAKALGPIIAGVGMLVAFGYVEARVAKEPLVPFKDLTKTLRAANQIVLFFSSALFAMWFVSSLYLQQVLGLSPLKTGLTFLPMTIVLGLVAPRAGKLVGRFGVRPVLGSGLIMLAAGLLLLARIEPSGSSIVYVMIPGLLAAAGIALSIVPSTIAATQGAKEGQAGLASGMVNTSRQVGGGLGLAIQITLATQLSTELIGSGHRVPLSLTEGFRLAYLIGAGCVAFAAVLTFLTMPKPSADRVSAARRLSLAALALVAVYVAATFAFANSRGAPIGAYLKTGTYSFVTEPSLHPPQMEIEHKPDTSKFAPGYILTANFYNISFPPMIGQSGPMILDDKLAPVWFKPVPEDVVASNLALQEWEGKPALSWWQGLVTNTGAIESGEDIVVNQHYQEVAHLKGADGWKLTLHEMLISGEDAWVTANKDIPHDLSPYGGAYNGAMIDSAVQEYNLRTGKLLYNWDALDHIPLSQSQATLPTNGFPWDAYHVNSIALVGNDSFLVSMRDTWAAYLVNIKTGKTEWTLGGRKSSFKFGPDAEFQWQHDVKVQPGGIVTMFDDHCCQLTGGGTYVGASAPSRGLVLKLNDATHTAEKVADYGVGYGLEADYMGDLQRLPNGNVMLGAGSEPYLSELTSQGEPVLEGRFPKPDLSYRTTLDPWVGEPLYPPAGAARSQDGKVTVYASWNGATQVRSWRVLAGSGNGGLATVATVAKSGFETAFPLSGSYRSFEVQALDASGRVIGTSKSFEVSG